ncbi:ComF family protein [Cognatilysobacter bugurensis]|uniref:Amidophosphoribosyltransferase n=1 Tax=Cognatilysobacter bugurensis TaxID=543356 RepID=A0A918T2P7_9GAMM|nr:ComF family protein [Lysobacter bugurensis]GHA88017.1 amidophosphoribosyltransferase [Lysobacter bugurensis]
MPVNQIALPPVDGAESTALRARLRFWLRLDAARLLWPSRCLVCDAPGGEALDLCDACNAALPHNRSACGTCALPLPIAAPACGSCLQRSASRAPTAAVHAPFVYAAPLDRLLVRFKFHEDLAAGRLLSQLMAQALADAPRPDALVPVPLHRARLRRRGYDQALELARPLGRALDLRVDGDLLVRTRATDAQSRLDADARRRNLRDAFALRPGAAVPAHVALVDDVMTTGATLRAAATALRRAGVQRVDAWVCARAP